MNLSPADSLYIMKRERLAKSWPVAGGLLLLLLAALAAWLWIKTPYLINPWLVIESLESGTLPESTTTIMVAMLPILVLTLLVLAAAVVLLAGAALANERRIIRLLRRLEQESRGDA